MKKTLIALLALGGMAMADTFTWDFTETGSQMGGTSTGGAFTTTTEEINGMTTTVLTGSTFYELGTDDLYDMVEDAYNENSVLTFSMMVKWGGDNTKYETFLHVGAQDTGITLAVSKGTLTFAHGNSYDSGKITGANLTEDKWQSITFTMFGNKTSATIDGKKYTGIDLPADGITWSTTASEIEKYSIGVNAPGHNNYTLAAGGTKMANMSVTSAPIPEPTTATLSLLALAGLAARRRRK